MDVCDKHSSLLRIILIYGEKSFIGVELKTSENVKFQQTGTNVIKRFTAVIYDCL
jgi:hypothetical protein